MKNSRLIPIKAMLAGLLLLPLGQMVSAGEGVLVRYNEDGHRIVRMLAGRPQHAQMQPSQLQPSQLQAQRRPMTLAVTRGQVRRDGKVALNILRRDGRQELIEMADPRLIRAPLRANGRGHEAVMVKFSGSYVIPLTDSASITALEIKLPELNAEPNRRLSQ